VGIAIVPNDSTMKLRNGPRDAQRMRIEDREEGHASGKDEDGAKRAAWQCKSGV